MMTFPTEWKIITKKKKSCSKPPTRLYIINRIFLGFYKQHTARAATEFSASCWEHQRVAGGDSTRMLRLGNSFATRTTTYPWRIHGAAIYLYMVCHGSQQQKNPPNVSINVPAPCILWAISVRNTSRKGPCSIFHTSQAMWNYQRVWYHSLPTLPKTRRIIQCPCPLHQNHAVWMQHFWPCVKSIRTQAMIDLVPDRQSVFQILTYIHITLGAAVSEIGTPEKIIITLSIRD